MVDRAGLEPAIPRLKGECCDQLSYRSGWANTRPGSVFARVQTEQVPVRNGTTRIRLFDSTPAEAGAVFAVVGLIDFSHAAGRLHGETTGLRQRGRLFGRARAGGLTEVVFSGRPTPLARAAEWTSAHRSL